VYVGTSPACAPALSEPSSRFVLAAAVGAESGGPPSGWRAVAIGAAIAIALVNMAHVVGLLLMESVRYRGGFARFFRTLSLVGTPAAVLLNLIILLSS
jgi:hypothetical protein